MSRLGVVVNPTAGSGRSDRLGVHATRLLRSRGHEVVDLSASSLVDATIRTRQGIVDGLDALVVVGGDGMTHLGANAVAGTTLPMGIIAGGTGNDIAHSLALPRHDVGAAVSAIEHGLTHGPRAVDAVQIVVPGQEAVEWYLGALSCGIDAAINSRANELRWPKGSARYVRALVSVLSGFRPYGFRVTMDGRVWESAGTLVAVANSPLIGGGVRIAPDALMDDGLLDVIVAGPFTKPQVVRIFPGMYAGRHVRQPGVEVVRARRVLIEPTDHGARPPDAFADGERVGPLPLSAEVHPGAVRVLG